MDLFQLFLNLVVPAIGIPTLLFLWPALAIWSLFSRAYRSVFEENVCGKVVVITGASSGIGEQSAYQYARRGAVLVLVGRREGRLRMVADRSIKRGAMDVRAITADVSNEEDCRKLIDDTVNHYGRLDHLVNNAGIGSSFLFEEVSDATPLKRVMDVDFWGYVYPTFYALPHLKRTRGKIIVNASVAAWQPFPRMSIYNAAQSAIFNFFDTLRVELGSSVSGVTIVTPGWIESEMTMGKFLDRSGKMDVDGGQRDVHVGPVPVAYSEECAKALVRGAVRGEKYVRVPFWYTTFALYRVFAPEVVDFVQALVYLTPAPWRKDRAPLSKAILDLPGVKSLVYPITVRSPRPSLKQLKGV